MDKSYYLDIGAWVLLAVIQAVQVLFASTLTYILFQNKVLLWSNEHELLYSLVIYLGGFLSYPLAGYLLYTRTKYFKNRSIKLWHVIILSVVIGVILSVKYIFPFGTIAVSLLFFAVLALTGIELFKQENGLFPPQVLE